MQHNPHLTRRERQMVQGALNGERNKEIAAQLGLSEYTVKVYMSRLYERLGINNRHELANFGRAYQAAEDLKAKRYAELYPDQPVSTASKLECMAVTEYDVFRAMADRITLTPEQRVEIYNLLSTHPL